MALSSGTITGNYIIEAAIARGGMAMIYRARHRFLESTHAIKVLNEELARSEEMRMRFLAEGKIQACHRHPHITPITDVIAEPGIAGLVMPFLEGEDLGSHLERRQRIATPVAVRWSQQVLSALAHVHRQGIVHRDLKPGNLFLETIPDEDARIRLMDFGIAKVQEQPRAWTRTRAGVMGTPSYMSPEQVRSPADVDSRSDIFVLGAVLYELLTGRVAFSGESTYDTQTLIVQGEFTPIRSLLPQLPPSLIDVIHRALSVDREARFASAREFSAALQLAKQFPVRIESPALSASTLQPPQPTPATQPADLARQQRAAKHQRKPQQREAAQAQQRQRADAQQREAAQAQQRRRAEAQRQATAQRQAEEERQKRAAARRAATQQRPAAHRVQLTANPIPCTIRGQVLELMPIAAGSFQMGTPPNARLVTLTRPFLLAKRQTTQALWSAVTGEEIGSFEGYGLPVEGVTWFEVVLFCNQLSKLEHLSPAYEIGPGRTPDVLWSPEASGYRLPTEAEWEYAARAQSDSLYSGGDDPARVGWFTENSAKKPQRVGMKLPNAWGLQDMSGNVHEWVWDRGGPYPHEAQSDPSGPRSGVARVLRGGSWRSIAQSALLTERIAEWPAKSRDDLGFRLARNHT